MFSSLLLSLLVLAGCTAGSLNNSSDDGGFIFGGQQHEDRPVNYWVSYHPTQCNSNPWAGESSGDQADTAMISYYEQDHGVTILDTETIPAGGDVIVCAACGCPTGSVIRVQVSEEDRLTLLDLGFIDSKDDIASETSSSVVPMDDMDATDTIGKLLDDPVEAEEDASVDAESVQELDDSADEVEGGEETGEETSEEDNSEADADSELDTSEETGTETDSESGSETGSETGAEAGDDATDNDVEIVERDIVLETIREDLQSKLEAYKSQYNYYPETLDALTFDEDLDLTDVTYTPIGTVPSNYYDLSIVFSTGKQIYNP